MRIFLKVPQILREYLVSTNKGNIISPRRDDTLWYIIKTNLVTTKDNFKRITPEEEKEGVYINLLNCRGTKTYIDGKEVYINTDYRYTLSAEGEKRVITFMHKRFKETFHTFIAAQRMGMPNKRISKIIRDFLDIYEIDDNAINESQLMKSWQRDWRYAWLRSPQCKMIDYGEIYCPAVV